jgi:hypothetical protein
MLRNVRRHLGHRHHADAPALRDQRVAHIRALREHVDDDVARDEQGGIRRLLGADDRNAHGVRVLLVERVVAERRRHRADIGLDVVVDQRLVRPVLRDRRDECRREHYRANEKRVSLSHGHHQHDHQQHDHHQHHQHDQKPICTRNCTLRAEAAAFVAAIVVDCPNVVELMLTSVPFSANALPIR